MAVIRIDTQTTNERVTIPDILGSISCLSQYACEVGDVISVLGSGLAPTTSASIGGIAATIVSVSDGRVDVKVPTGALSGPILLISSGGTIASPQTLSVVDPNNLTIVLGSTPSDPRVNPDPQNSITTLAGSTINIGTASFLSELIRTSVDNAVAGSIDFTGRFVWSGACDRIGYLYYMSDSAGAFYLRVAAGTFITFVPSIRGAEAGVATGIIGVIDGDEFEWRHTYEAASFDDNVIEYRINGVAQVSARASQGGPAGPAIPTPTAFYFGSDNTGANIFPVQKLTYFSSVPYTTLPQNRGYEIVVFGDSMMAGAYSASQRWKVTSTGIYRPEERWTRPGIYSFAAGGSTTATQQALWDASAMKGAAGIKAFIIQTGYNDLVSGGLTSAQLITAIQALVTDCHTANPTAKILIEAINPTKGSMTGGQFTNLQAYNAAVAAWVSNFTNVNFGITAHYNLLSNGSDNYRPEYSMGDNTHPNDGGRSVMSGQQRAALVAVGVLPNP